MLSDTFRLGHLNMSSEVLDPVTVTAEWKDFPLNRITCIVTIILWLMLLSEYFSLLPSLRYCLQRAKGSVSLEHSLSLSKARNQLAAGMFLPICLLADRYQLFAPSWWSRISDGYTLMFTAAILLAFIALRQGIYYLPLPKKLKGEERLAIRGLIFNIFLLALPMILASAGIASLAGLSDKFIRCTIYAETGIFLLLVWAREFEILMSQCSGFSTFLYLCALEILPVGILIFESLQ